MIFKLLYRPNIVLSLPLWHIVDHILDLFEKRILVQNIIANYKITPTGKYKLFYGVIFRNASWCEIEITYINFVLFI